MSIVELLKYIFLGLIQGLTEVLPISSSGHVALSQELLQITADEGILFLTLVNIGSLLAILYHFRKIINKLIAESFKYVFGKNKNEEYITSFRYVLLIVVATIPTIILGYTFSKRIDLIYHQYPMFVVGVGLLITATFLYSVRFAPNKHIRQEVSLKDAIIIGLVQPFSIFPGISRSGITTSTGLMRKTSMETSLTFSFMLYIPISIGSLVLFAIRWVSDPQVVHFGLDSSNSFQLFYYLAAFIASFTATKISLKYIFKWFRQGKLVYFAIYTLLLGLIALAIGIITY